MVRNVGFMIPTIIERVILLSMQLALPHEHKYEVVKSVEDGWSQIRDMKVGLSICAVC